MKIIHYILFLPPAILCGYYIKQKLDILFPKQKKNKWQEFFYYAIVLLVFTISILTLSYFAVFFFYIAFFYALFDILFIIFKRSKKGTKFLKNIYQKGFAVLLFAIMITTYGMYTAHHPAVHTFEFDIQKKFKQTKIVMLSDLHLGTGSTELTVDTIIDEVNKQKADLFVLVGDIFDERTSDSLKEYAYQNFGEVNTTYGTYLVEGNHDHINNSQKMLWEKHQVTVLLDQTKKIANNFYLIGRKDYSRKNRQSLDKLVEGVDQSLPIIILDHQPRDEKKASQVGADLQLSGHTHNGQLFPGGLFVKHGTHQIGNYRLIISNGYGTWGIPVRTSGKSELIVVDLK